MINANGAVTTSRLVETFKVSAETIRRDLLTLEGEGALTRAHGGAIAKNEMSSFRALKERNLDNFDQKRELATYAAEFISEGDIIAVDSGSTATAFAEIIKEKFSKLTVVTHSIDVFDILRSHGGFSLILCGGNYMPSENAFFGELTLGALDGLHIQKAFLFPSAISLKYGVFDYQKELYQAQRKISEISNEVFLLADSSKFEKTALYKLADVNAEHTFVTDSNLSAELIELYERNGVKLYYGNQRK